MSLTGSLQSKEMSEKNALVTVCCAAMEIALGSATRSMSGSDAVPIISGVSVRLKFQGEIIDAPISHLYPHLLSDVFPPVALPSNLNGFL